jgi:hypothetical protein
LFDVLITVFYDGVYKSKVFQFGCLVWCLPDQIIQL